MIEDIIELTFEGLQQFKLVLFQCRWFHPQSGIRKSPNIGLVEINPNTRLPGYEPFVLPHQCKQVYYTPYPCQTGDLRNWWVVHPSPQRGNLRLPEFDDVEETPSSMFYQENTSTGSFTVEEGNDLDHNIGVGEAEVIHDSSDIELLISYLI